jgi:ribonucleoside-diphosphate reductase beta chain
MKNNNEINIFKEKKEFYSPEYQWALDLIDQQNAVFWRFNETNIEADFHDLKHNLTPAELTGISEALRLFTLYETHIGNDYWSGVIRKVFKQPEIQMLAATNSYFEVVHARAYNEINKCLGLDTEEFYTSYKLDPLLSDRIQFIEDNCNIPKDYNALDILKSIGTFLFIEGAVLYSSFAFIKHFSSNGKNFLKNVNAAIDYSIRDEGGIHVTSGEMLFKTLKVQAELTVDEDTELTNHLIKIARKTFEHEEKIMDKLFAGGKIVGITENQMKTFIRSRVNECLKCLDIQPYFEKETYNPIESWFYNNVVGLKQSDFFHKKSAQYSRKWIKHKFIW